MTRDKLFADEAASLGYSFDGEIKIGGNYVPLLQDGNHIYISGQIPRVGDTVVFTGAAGAGAHSRTSVGVFQLPKNATVEIDFIVTVD